MADLWRRLGYEIFFKIILFQHGTTFEMKKLQPLKHFILFQTVRRDV